MHPAIQQLLKVQEVDSQLIFLKESLRLRPRELDEDRRKTAQVRANLEAKVAQIKQGKVQAYERELDVKKSDGEIEKLTIALNQAKSNQEYTIFREQIKKQEEGRGKAEEDVIMKLTELDALEVDRKDLAAGLEVSEKALKRREAEVEELLKGLREQIAELEGRRGGLVGGIERETLEIYQRVLARHNNFAVTRVEGSVCTGCYMSVTNQEINLLMQGQLVQCRNCLRLLYV